MAGGASVAAVSFAVSECPQFSLQFIAVNIRLAKYKLDLVGVREGRWDKEGTVRAGDYFFLWKRKQKSSVGNRIFCKPQNSISS